jgi:HAE1 family hydrophobic/amphiphilic exporter-1
VPGVGDINARTDQFSIRVWMNPEKMASHGLIPQDVINALNAQNVQVAAGSAGAPPQYGSQTFELGILVNGQLKTVPDFEKVIVKTVPSTGEMIYLKDVARVELGKFTYSSNSFVDGKRASILMIFQSPGSNALQTADNVYAALIKMKKSFPADVDYKVPFESITIIKVSMNEVVKTRTYDQPLYLFLPYLYLFWVLSAFSYH